VSLVGHSAGAQLCAMALIHRAAATQAAAAGAAPHNPDAASTTATTTAATAATNDHTSSSSAATKLSRDLRMPLNFIGVAGVYDISKHYEYESDRSVQELSTMKRAIGGLGMAAAVSPSVVLATALRRAARAAVGVPLDDDDYEVDGGGLRGEGGGLRGAGGGAEEGDEAAAVWFYREFPLAGEAIAHRIGFDRGSGHYDARESLLSELSLRGAESIPSFPLEAAAYLPPTVLLSR
jgi:hypothetical protein